MALVGNISLLHKSPAKYTTGTVGFNDRANWNKPGMMRSRGDLTVSTLWKYDAVPAGMYAGTAFFPPQKTGAITSRNRARIDISTSALAVGGITTTGTADFSIVTNTPAGQLISSGTGTASMTFTFANALLTASLSAIGSASFTLATNTPLLGAIASGIGNGTFTITGSLTPYAIGSMIGSTVDTSSIVNANIVSVNGYSVTGNGQTGTEWGPVI